jgi:hypothetical protein
LIIHQRPEINHARELRVFLKALLADTETY